MSTTKKEASIDEAKAPRNDMKVKLCCTDNANMTKRYSGGKIVDLVCWRCGTSFFEEDEKKAEKIKFLNAKKNRKIDFAMSTKRKKTI